jgi:hypothetical protein
MSDIDEVQGVEAETTATGNAIPVEQSYSIFEVRLSRT